MKKISIIIPVKNGENYLAEALEGIRAQALDVEVIVVDDHSDDNTSAIAEKYGCTLIHHAETKGQSVGKNTGLKYATGEFVLFHDHDDVLTPDALRTLCQPMEQDPDVMVVMGKAKDFLSPDAKNRNAKIKEAPYFGFLSGAMLFRRSVFDIIGPFSEKTTAGETIDLTNRLMEHQIKIYRLDFISVMRRIHDTNFGITHRAKEYSDYAKLLRERLKLRRQQKS